MPRPSEAAQQPPTLLSRLRDRVTAWVADQWQAVQTAESGMKFYTRRAVDRLLEYVTDEERFLRGIPYDAQSAVVLHSCGEGCSDAVTAELLELARTRKALHERWYRVSCAALTVTVPLMLLPFVPAIPAYWNVFRVWAHRKALRGATRLEHLLLPRAAALAAPPLPPCTRLDDESVGECCRVAASWHAAAPGERAVVVPCTLLARLTGDDDSVMSSAADLARRLEVPHLAEHTRERLRALRRLQASHHQRLER